MLFLFIPFITIIYSFACLFVGGSALRILSSENTENLSISAGTELATAYLLGQGILANIWLLIALYGDFSPIIVGIIVSLLTIGGIAQNYKLIFHFIQQLTNIYNESKSEPAGWKLIIVLTLLICMAWGTSLGRSPIGDGSAFYLPIAKLIAVTHQLAPLPGFEELATLGLQGEMHFAALMSLGSPGAAQLFSWPTILAGAILLLALAKNVGLKRHGQWLVLAMLFTSSAVVELSGSGKIDLFAAALGLAAYYWAIRIREVNRSSIFWLVGLFTGLAVIAKISYVVTFGPSLAIIIIWSYSSWSRQAGVQIFNTEKLLQCILIFVSGLLIAIIPHLVKNYILFQNPFAPFGSTAGGLQDQTWYGPETTRRILFTIPFALTYGDYWAQLGNLTPLVLAFSPLALFLPKPSRIMNSPLFIVTISAIIGVMTWFIVRPSVLAPRYLMACLLLLIIPAARAAEFITSIPVRPTVLYRTIIAITIVTLINHGWYYLDRVFFPKQTYQYLSGQLTECEKATGYCRIITIINNSVEPGARLFTKTFARYWLRSDLIQCTATTDEINAYKSLDTDEQRWSFIYGRGFRYIPILYFTDPLQNIIHEDLKHIPNWLNVTRIEDGKNILLELRSIDPSHQPGVGCTQISPPAWGLFNLHDL